MDLSLDVEQNSSVTSCLRSFSSTETLTHKNKFFCESCNALQVGASRVVRLFLVRLGLLALLALLACFACFACFACCSCLYVRLLCLLCLLACFACLYRPNPYARYRVRVFQLTCAHSPTYPIVLSSQHARSPAQLRACVDMVP